MPSFLSTTGLTASSWLQKRHGKRSGRGSRCDAEVSVMTPSAGIRHVLTFLGPCGLLELFLLPIVVGGVRSVRWRSRGEGEVAGAVAFAPKYCAGLGMVLGFVRRCGGLQVKFLSFRGVVRRECAQWLFGWWAGLLLR